jgi:hypothetical protein
LSFKVLNPDLDGVLDLGGASTQIATVLKAGLQVGDTVDATNILSRSFMHFGFNGFWEAAEKTTPGVAQVCAFGEPAKGCQELLKGIVEKQETSGED